MKLYNIFFQGSFIDYQWADSAYEACCKSARGTHFEPEELEAK